MSSLVLISLGAALIVLGVVGTPARLPDVRRLAPLFLLPFGLAALGGGLVALGLAGLLGAMMPFND